MMFFMRRTVPKNSLGLFILTLSLCLLVSIIWSNVNVPSSDSSILPEELANQSVRLKEEQLRREEEKVCATYIACDPHC